MTEAKSCSVATCDREAVTRGWCHAHYLRWRRGGDVRPDVPIGGHERPERCTVEGCPRKTYARTWCEMHYRRWKRSGDVKAEVPPLGTVTRLCEIDDCTKPVDGRDLCHGHFQRVLRQGDATPEEPLERRKQPETCTVEGCDRDSNAKGLCKAHRNRQVRHGDVMADVPVRESTGVWIQHGYRMVSVPEELRHLTEGATYTAEHRLVMARILGRPLRPHEHVHHRDADRLNNHPANLELWTRSHPSGSRVADKIAYAVRILRIYRPELLRDDA